MIEGAALCRVQFSRHPDPHLTPTPQFVRWDSGLATHTIPLKRLHSGLPPLSFVKRLTGGYVKILRQSMKVRPSMPRVYAVGQLFRPICPTTASIVISRESDLGLDGKKDYDSEL